MIIDEGFTCMDELNLGNIRSILMEMRRRFDFILLVSHLVELKGNCDEYISITKKGGKGESRVEYN